MRHKCFKTNVPWSKISIPGTLATALTKPNNSEKGTKQVVYRVMILVDLDKKT
jgi:hypothetical protein